MKQSVYIAFTAMSLCVSAFAAPISDEIRVINVQDITPGDLEKIGNDAFRDIIAFPKNAQLPLQLFLKGDVVQLTDTHEDAGTIEVLQTFYVRLDSKMPLVSKDLIEWKRLDTFFAGEMSTGLECSSEGRHTLSFSVQANERH